jgi:hypothetical protein
MSSEFRCGIPISSDFAKARLQFEDNQVRFLGIDFSWLKKIGECLREIHLFRWSAQVLVSKSAQAQNRNILSKGYSNWVCDIKKSMSSKDFYCCLANVLLMDTFPTWWTELDIQNWKEIDRPKILEMLSKLTSKKYQDKITGRKTEISCSTEDYTVCLNKVGSPPDGCTEQDRLYWICVDRPAFLTLLLSQTSTKYQTWLGKFSKVITFKYDPSNEDLKTLSSWKYQSCIDDVPSGWTAKDLSHWKKIGRPLLLDQLFSAMMTATRRLHLLKDRSEPLLSDKYLFREPIIKDTEAKRPPNLYTQLKTKIDNLCPAIKTE